MSRRERWALGIFAAITAMAMTSCGGSPVSSLDTSSTEVKIKGKVTLWGSPMNGGRIFFSPSNVSRPVGPRSASISPQGTYEIQTLIGDNNVNVESLDPATQKKMGRQGRIIRVETDSSTIDLDLPFTKP